MIDDKNIDDKNKFNYMIKVIDWGCSSKFVKGEYL